MSSSRDKRTNEAPAEVESTSAGDLRTSPSPRRGRTAPAGVNRRRRTGAAPRALIETAGPEPSAGLEHVKLTVGVIAGSHGVSGEMKLKLLTDHPEHLATIRRVYLGESDEPTRLLGVRVLPDQALIRLEGVSSPEEAKRLGGLKVRIAGSDAKPLEEGEYFLYQLVGLAALSEDGEKIGTVTDLMETGANDVLVITEESGQEMLVPNHPQFVISIAPDEGMIVIRPPVYDN